MGRLRRRLSYANVIATVAVFLALGGGAYAAVSITGRDVVNRALTGKDIKKRSVPLNRLKGRPARGRRGVTGPPGPQGAQGPAGPVDPYHFLPASGATTVAVGPTQWQPLTLANSLTRSAVEANRVEWSAPAASASEFLALEPTLPIALAGRPTRLVAATVCYSTTDPQVRLTVVFIGQYRGPLLGAGGSAPAGEFADPTARDESACRRFTPGPSFVLEPGAYVNVRLRFDFDAAADVHVGASSFELQRG